MNQAMRLCISLLFAAYVGDNILAQDQQVKEIAAVYAEGKMAGDVYKNEYFGLILTAWPGEFTKGGFLSSEGKRARLVDIQNNSADFPEKFEIAVLADSLAANPSISTPDQYVRAVRHQFEKRGMQAEDVQSSADVSGRSFVRTVLKITDGDRIYYRAIYSTFMNGYILSLDVTAATPEKIAKVIARSVKFGSRQK